MPVPVLLKNLLVGLIAIAFVFQALLATQGAILCRHADGTVEVEYAAQQAACHEDFEAAHESDSVSSPECFDQALPPKAVAHQTTSSSLRIELAPLRLAALPWMFATIDEPDAVPQSQFDETPPTAAAQRSELISSIVLII